MGSTEDFNELYRKDGPGAKYVHDLLTLGEEGNNAAFNEVHNYLAGSTQDFRKKVLGQLTNHDKQLVTQHHLSDDTLKPGDSNTSKSTNSSFAQGLVEEIQNNAKTHHDGQITEAGVTLMSEKVTTAIETAYSQ